MNRYPAESLKTFHAFIELGVRRKAERYNTTNFLCSIGLLNIFLSALVAIR
jgi:hypothetical protein